MNKTISKKVMKIMNPMRDAVRKSMLKKDDDIQTHNAYSESEKKETDES